ncbi:hypothetical protein QJQ45_013920, partial [Haematococcus lacustris]
MGAVVRTFDMRDLDQSGFTLKPSALLLSSFQEVLLLDADNFAVADPTPLFNEPGYQATGSLLWQDFWEPSAAPQVYRILGIPGSRRPPNSHESGQMLVDKTRHWQGLLLCVIPVSAVAAAAAAACPHPFAAWPPAALRSYLNYYHEVYYELLTGFMGKGDKETFVHAMLAMGEAVHTVPYPTMAVGMWRKACHVDSHLHPSCEQLLSINTMAQPCPNGHRVLFLHSNLNKWGLDLPHAFEDYSRRWLLLAVHSQSQPLPFIDWAVTQLGYDVERYAYELVRALRCAPWFGEYYRMRLRRGDAAMVPFNGPHELVGGMHLVEWYR